MHPCAYDVFHQIRLYKHDDDDDDRVLDCSQRIPHTVIIFNSLS